MSKMSESDWAMDLADILDQLDDKQLKKLKLCLTKIPKGVQECKSREQLVRLVLEYYGSENSVHVIQRAMDQIPRRDSAVQDLLKPHVDQLRDKENQENKENCENKENQENKENKENKENTVCSKLSPQDIPKGNKRAVESASDSEEEVQRPKGQKKKRVLCDSEDDEKPCKQEVKIPAWRKTVTDVKNCGALEKNKAMVAKLVQKSGIRKYKTQRQIKPYFIISVADHTDCLKVMVYGMQRFSELEQGQVYSFRDVLMDLDQGVMKITISSNVSQTSIKLDLPDDIEIRAQTIVYSKSPVLSIRDIKRAPEKSSVSVEGKITKIGVLEEVKLKAKRRTLKNKMDLWISDGSDTIKVCLWGQDVQQLRDKTVGDVVRVINVRTNCYYDNTSLNSTDYTQIIKVSSAPVQNVSIEVIGVAQANHSQTQLEAVLNEEEVLPFFIESRILAKALGVRLEGDFKDQLLKKVQFKAQVEIKGSTINTIDLN